MANEDNVERAVAGTARTKNNMQNAVVDWGYKHMTSIFCVFLLIGLIIYLCCSIEIANTQPTWTLVTDIFFRFVITMAYWSNLYYSGMQRGHMEENYVGARDYISMIISTLRDHNMLKDVDNFCVEYVKDELENYRKGLITAVGIDYTEEYRKHYQNMTVHEIEKLETRIGQFVKVKDKNGELKDVPLKLSKQQKINIIKAINAKPRRLTYDMLIGGLESKRTKRVISPTERELTKVNGTIKVVRYLACALITAIWTVTPVVTTATSVIGTIACMLMLIVMASFGGYTVGFQTASEGGTRNLVERSEILIIMCEKNGISLKKSETK